MIIWPTPKAAVDAALTILEEAFTGVAAVSAKMPARNVPEKFVRVTRAGGTQPHPATDNARILVECFALTPAMTEALCNTARAALRNAAGTTVTASTADIFIRAWENEDGPTDFPHPDILDRERWQFHGTLAVKSN